MEDFYQLLNNNYTENDIPKELVELAKLVLDSYSNINPQKIIFQHIPFQGTMEIISKFLKEEYGLDFYNQFMNNLYRGKRVTILFGMKNEIDNLKYELSVLDFLYQKKKISSNDFHERESKLKKHIDLIRASEDVNLSSVDAQTGNMIIDLKETIEDAFIILHEGMHRIYTPCMEETDSCRILEIPSLCIEEHFYHFCKRNKLFLKEIKKYARKKAIQKKNMQFVF